MRWSAEDVLACSSVQQRMHLAPQDSAAALAAAARAQRKPVARTPRAPAPLQPQDQRIHELQVEQPSPSAGQDIRGVNSEREPGRAAQCAKAQVPGFKDAPGVQKAAAKQEQSTAAAAAAAAQRPPERIAVAHSVQPKRRLKSAGTSRPPSAGARETLYPDLHHHNDASPTIWPSAAHGISQQPEATVTPTIWPSAAHGITKAGQADKRLTTPPQAHAWVGGGGTMLTAAQDMPYAGVRHPELPPVRAA